MAVEVKALLGNTLILDLTSGRGSFCPKLLADLGARVIRIESPDGDPARKTGPFFGSQSLSFAYHNANKHEIVLNLETPQGKQDFHALLEKADILVEALATGRLQNLELESGSLDRINPRLIHISIPVEQSSYPLSLYGAVAAVLCLIKRDITGKGCHIDFTYKEAIVSAQEHAGSDDGSQLFHILPCKDGFIQITILRNWETLLEIMVSEQIAGDLLGKEWQEETYRESHIQQIAKITAEWTRRHSKKELFQLGQAMRFPWAPVETPAEVLESPQLRQRNFFVPTALPGGGPVMPFPGIPYKFSPSVPALQTESALQIQNKRNVRPIKCMAINDEEILKGLRVIDLTRMLAGPYATRMLADYGAEVIKIQSKVTAQGAERNDSEDFGVWNRNKRSLSLDLSHPEARELFLELAAVSDIVVENYSPRVMANWGLEYSRLRQANPDLIMASISAMGQSGPWKDFVGFAPTFHALSGLLSILSPSSDEPVNIPYPYGDLVTAAYSTLAILAAGFHRERTGEGQHIDISAFETLCTLIGPALIASAANVTEKNIERNFFGAIFPDLFDLWPWQEEKPRCWKKAPSLGQDNRYVVMELLGHSESEYESFAGKGVLR
jgi:crotonobetainyl-CoA:carnitine CoA-transferase CaiB-like acyl-CoA transferase